MEAYMRAEEAAAILGVNPQNLRTQARDDPKKLGFNVVIVGNKVIIPRKPFYEFMGIEYEAE